MQMNWNQFIGKTVNVTMFENFGVVSPPNVDAPIYEIVFKTGALVAAYDDGLLLDVRRDGENVKIFISHKAIKCVEVYGV
jgi:hypothetical protein